MTLFERPPETAFEALVEIIVRGGLTCLAWAFDVVSVNGGYYIGKVREEDKVWNSYYPRQRQSRNSPVTPEAVSGPGSETNIFNGKAVVRCAAARMN